MKLLEDLMWLFLILLIGFIGVGLVVTITIDLVKIISGIVTIL